ncbi:hypothetical protein HK105_200432 [Polyrhizophydium stewartii]|uniref:Uncharacterized protein n=1 Tax=Polyrhizophydium stewartii TaxID=2732419 RepID=A0ABR4NLN9_9FUNG
MPVEIAPTVVEVVEPFDPTSFTAAEVERFRKQRWPSQISFRRETKPADTAKPGAEPLNVFKPKGALRCSGGECGDRFPLAEVIETEKTKKVLMVNPRSRFVLQLREVARERRRKEELIRQSGLTSSSYDWALVKSLSKETKFSRYIAQLERRSGKAIEDSLTLDSCGKDERADEPGLGKGDEDTDEREALGHAHESHKSGRLSVVGGPGTASTNGADDLEGGLDGGGDGSDAAGMAASHNAGLARSSRHPKSETPINHADGTGHLSVGLGSETNTPDAFGRPRMRSIATHSRRASTMPGAGVTGSRRTKATPTKLNSRGAGNGHSLRRSDSLVQMREYIDASHFRPKRKGELAIKRYKEEVPVDHYYGRPKELKENEGDEFNRTFGEIHQLGETVKDKVILMNSDKENFNIPRTIAAAIEAAQNEAFQRRISRRTNSKSGSIAQDLDARGDPMAKREEEFMATRKMLHKALLSTLHERKQDRLRVSEATDKIIPLIELVEADMRKHARKSKTPPAWDMVSPYLWFKDTPELVKSGRMIPEPRFAIPQIGISPMLGLAMAPASPLYPLRRQSTQPRSSMFTGDGGSGAGGGGTSGGGVNGASGTAATNGAPGGGFALGAGMGGGRRATDAGKHGVDKQADKQGDRPEESVDVKTMFEAVWKERKSVIDVPEISSLGFSSMNPMQGHTTVPALPAVGMGMSMGGGTHVSALAFPPLGSLASRRGTMMPRKQSVRFYGH